MTPRIGPETSVFPVDGPAVVTDVAIEGLQRTRRRMKRLRESRDVGLNIVPLVDVTFLLMIFFVLAGAFDMWEGVLATRMPRTSAALAVPLPISPVRVRIQQTGPGPDDFAVAVEGVPRRPASFSELSVLLQDVQQTPGLDADTPLVIVSDAGVRWDHVVNVWNAAVRARFHNIAFGDR